MEYSNILLRTPLWLYPQAHSLPFTAHKTCQHFIRRIEISINLHAKRYQSIAHSIVHPQSTLNSNEFTLFERFRKNQRTNALFKRTTKCCPSSEPILSPINPMGGETTNTKLSAQQLVPFSYDPSEEGPSSQFDIRRRQPPMGPLWMLRVRFSILASNELLRQSTTTEAVVSLCRSSTVYRWIDRI